MRQFILTILVISNIGAGIEVVTDFEDATAESDVFTVADGLQASLPGDNSDPATEASCDHCCHGASHFSGAIVVSVTLPYMRASSDAVFTDTKYQLAGRSPPTPPPNA